MRSLVSMQSSGKPSGNTPRYFSHELEPISRPRCCACQPTQSIEEGEQSMLHSASQPGWGPGTDARTWLRSPTAWKEPERSTQFGAYTSSRNRPRQFGDAECSLIQSVGIEILSPAIESR